MKKLLISLLIIPCLFASTTVALANGESPTQTQDTKDERPQTHTEAESADPQSEEEDTITDTPRLADGAYGRGTVENPDQYWAENGYPDDISYAFEAGGEMLNDGTILSYWEIGVVNASQERRQKILDLLAPSCVVTFFDCTYSYHQREAAYNEISLMEDTAIHQVIMIRNTEIVVVEVDKQHVQEYADRFANQYGSFVVVSDGADIAKDDTTQTSAADSTACIWFVSVIPLIGIAIALYLKRARFKTAMQTAQGSVITQSAPISRKAAISAVKDSEVAPREDIYNAILEKMKD